ncbi:ABC transporter [Ruegeria sp. HKCCD4315]|nr:ABC transporter [Ruegeria sp. HKCCD4332]NOD88132.1 ABC transporter [Ruegeria sp. HKCCD4318]NOE14980.1 ABC transporter [Ruegeria sp. HKCCD4318-2]NOG11417.1 ABC transporter [Ruegeria sp. HKCCD4315]
MKIPAKLALRELRHDWQSALCFVAALAGVLGPLLIILALKNGVIGTMVGRLIEDPSNREILAIGAGQHDAAFFAALGARQDVGFIVPATRSINTSANAVRNEAQRKLERAVPLIPTAAGDPLIDGEAVSPGTVWVSDKLAQDLSVTAGDTLDMIIGREVDGQRENARRDLTVIGVVPAEIWPRSAIFLSVPDLLAVERFRDDLSVTPGNWTDPVSDPDSYASYRLYARTLEDIGTLSAHLTDLGLQTRPRAENAALLLSFRRNLNLLFTAIAALAMFGFWAAMSANLRGMVERQRVIFSLFSMLTMPDRQRCVVPVVQSLTLVLGGVVATLVLILPFLLAINATFETAPGESVARLYPGDILATLVLGAVTAVTAAIWAVFAVRNVEPQEVLTHA